MGSNLEDAAGELGVDTLEFRTITSGSGRRKECIARFITRRWVFVAAAVASAAGAATLLASSRSSGYPWDHDPSNTRPGLTTIFPSLSMALTIVLYLGFEIVWNIANYEDFFGSTTYYGVHHPTSIGGAADVIAG